MTLRAVPVVCRAVGVPLAASALLAGCAQPAPPAVAPAIVYSVDLQGGARVCTAPQQLVLAQGKTTTAQIVVRNDGGWCAIAVAEPGPMPTPYGAGLLAERPAHGKVYIHPVGRETRIDYTPAPGYAGPDRFAVQLLPGAGTLQVAVTVQPGAPVAR
jgi:hypothetical protein